MTDDAPPSQHDKKDRRAEESEKHSSIEKQVGVPLRELSRRVEALISEIRTQGETDHRDRQEYQQQESNRLRVDTRWNRILSGLTLVVGALTLWILFRTYGVYSTMNQTYNKQATIMATQAAIMDKQAAITKRQLDDFEAAQRASLYIGDPFLDAQRGNISVGVRNIGKSTAVDAVLVIYSERLLGDGTVVGPCKSPPQRLEDIPAEGGSPWLPEIDPPQWDVATEPHEVLTGAESVIVGGAIKYSDGFGPLPDFSFCRQSRASVALTATRWAVCTSNTFDALKSMSDSAPSCYARPQPQK
jgi:hypothetical protein